MEQIDQQMELCNELTPHHDEANIPESDRLYINVGGTIFITSRYALRRYPYTRLGKLAFTYKKEMHFDRNPKLMSYILDLYRTGELHVPRNCCSMAMKSEMIFWDIPAELVSECCWAVFTAGDQNKAVIDDIEETLKDPYEGITCRHKFYNLVWNTMSNPGYSVTAKIWNIIYDTFVALASLTFVMESEPTLRYIPDEVKLTMNGSIPTPGQFRFLMYSVEVLPLYALDMICWIFFTIEFFVRFFFCPRKSVFIKSKLNIMDVFLLTTVWIIVGLKQLIDMKIHQTGEFFFLTRVTMNTFKAMRVLRIFTVLYRNEYTKVMLLSLNASLHPLSLLMVAAMMAAFIFGAIAYMVELSMGSYNFRNIALATWWGYETMTAIGYGQAVPVTIPGYIIAVCCGMFGVVAFAMPIAIISESFQQYMVNLRAHKHRKARANYTRNQGRQNAFRSMNMFKYGQTPFNSSGEPPNNYTKRDSDIPDYFNIA